jgi:seryl-tRNA synthetase
MTERKPPSMDTKDWVEAQIKQAQNRGEFENLAGAGKPIPKLADPHDSDWWVKDFIRREKIETDVLLPPTMQLRKEKARIREHVATMRTEAEVREYVEELNKRILLQVRDATGPVIPVGKTDEDAVLRQWREDRDAQETAQPEPTSEPEPAPKRSLWQRLFS